MRLAFVLVHVFNTSRGIVLFSGILLGYGLFIASNNHANKQVQHTIINYNIVFDFR